MKKLLVYGAGLIALYLIVEHGTSSGTVVTDGATGAVNIVKSLQGR